VGLLYKRSIDLQQLKLKTQLKTILPQFRFILRFETGGLFFRTFKGKVFVLPQKQKELVDRKLFRPSKGMKVQSRGRQSGVGWDAVKIGSDS
jgi:hypothetical protein